MRPLPLRVWRVLDERLIESSATTAKSSFATAQPQASQTEADKDKSGGFGDTIHNCAQKPT